MKYSPSWKFLSKSYPMTLWKLSAHRSNSSWEVSCAHHHWHVDKCLESPLSKCLLPVWGTSGGLTALPYLYMVGKPQLGSLRRSRHDYCVKKHWVFCHCICLLASDEAKEILGYDICISCSSLFWKYVWHSVDREYHLSFWPVLPNPQIDWYPHQKSLSLLLFSSLFSEQTNYWNQQKEVCSFLSLKKERKINDLSLMLIKR